MFDNQSTSHQQIEMAPIFGNTLVNGKRHWHAKYTNESCLTFKRKSNKRQ